MYVYIYIYMYTHVYMSPLRLSQVGGPACLMLLYYLHVHHSKYKHSVVCTV